MYGTPKEDKVIPCMVNGVLGFMPESLVDAAEKDMVNKPSHYQSGKFEVIDVIEAFHLDKDFYLANVIKYILRSGKKENTLQDLKKARWYLDRKIQNLEQK